MTNNTNFELAVENCKAVKMGERHEALRQIYQETPEKARIIDGAKTSSRRVSATRALYTEVEPFNAPEPYKVGVHKAVGGESDFPVPGDILCAAAAACLDSCIRIIANRLGIELTELEVTATAKMDVHGTLRLNDDIPVGFQNMDIAVKLETRKPVQDALIDAMLSAAEHSCVIVQTLRNAPQINVSRVEEKPYEEAPHVLAAV